MLFFSLSRLSSSWSGKRKKRKKSTGKKKVNKGKRKKAPSPFLKQKQESGEVFRENKRSLRIKTVFCQFHAPSLSKDSLSPLKRLSKALSEVPTKESEVVSGNRFLETCVCVCLRWS